MGSALMDHDYIQSFHRISEAMECDPSAPVVYSPLIGDMNSTNEPTDQQDHFSPPNGNNSEEVPDSAPQIPVENEEIHNGVRPAQKPLTDQEVEDLEEYLALHCPYIEEADLPELGNLDFSDFTDHSIKSDKIDESFSGIAEGSTLSDSSYHEQSSQTNMGEMKGDPDSEEAYNPELVSAPSFVNPDQIEPKKEQNWPGDSLGNFPALESVDQKYQPPPTPMDESLYFPSRDEIRQHLNLPGKAGPKQEPLMNYAEFNEKKICKTKAEKKRIADAFERGKKAGAQRVMVEMAIDIYIAVLTDSSCLCNPYYAEQVSRVRNHFLNMNNIDILKGIQI